MKKRREGGFCSVGLSIISKTSKVLKPRRSYKVQNPTAM